MFERFTERARKVVVLAQEEARHFNHNYIGTEHLLLGLLREDEGVAAQALNHLNITLDDVRDQIESIVGYGEEGSVGQAPFTPRSKQVLELSLKESMRLGHNYIGTEHLLLGLLDETEGVASMVLANLGVERDAVRREVLRRLGADDPGPASVGEEEGVSPGVVGRMVRETMRRMGRERGARPDKSSLLCARIEDLEVNVRFGATDEERSRPRKLYISLDYSREVEGDEAANVVDHAAVIRTVSDFVKGEEFSSLEAIVGKIGTRAMESFPSIADLRVSIKLTDISAPRPVGSVSVWASSSFDPRLP